MDLTKLRAWCAGRQGLDGSLAGAAPEDVLRDTGWARSVGGVNPYLQIFARAGTSRTAVDRAVADLRLHELPSARGCNYVLPASDFGFGLAVGAHAPQAEVRNALKLGVSQDELDTLADKVAGLVGDEPLGPRELKPLLGDAVRNLGEAGKKKGLSTTLPVVLGVLQARGLIRRVPVGGRLDTQRYGYVRWTPPALPDLAEARSELARRYWTWTGGASLAHFRWFSALGAKEAKDAVAELGLVPLDGDLLALPEDARAYAEYVPPAAPTYALTGWIDGIALLRRDLGLIADEPDRERIRSAFNLGGLSDLPAQAIVDRGRLAGLWDFDHDAGEIVWASFTAPDDALREAVARTEEFVRDQLGDVRGSSQDNPAKRGPRLAALRALG